MSTDSERPRAGTADHLPTAAPSRHDPVAARASTLVGGPLGRRATGGRGVLGSRGAVLLLIGVTLVVMSLGWLQKGPCRDGWTGDYAYTRLCYTDVLALWYAEGLNEGRTPFVEHAVEYPVGIGALMAVGKTLTAPFADADGAKRFYDVTALLMTGCAVVAVLTTGALAGRRRWWDAAMVALAPVLVLHGTINWDLAAVALTGLGMLAWARGRPWVAGLLLGAATATKLYPALVLVALLLLCLRARELGAWAKATLGTVAGVLVFYVPTYLISPRFSAAPGGQSTVVAPTPLTDLGNTTLVSDPYAALFHPLEALRGLATALAPHSGGGESSLLRFLTLNRERPADWDSLWFGWQQWTGTTIAAGTLNVLVAITLLGLVASIAVLVLRAPRRPRLAQVLFLLVVAFLISNKVYSPQYSLWLLPLAVLARPRWGMLLAWQAAECAVLASRFYYFVGGVDDPSKGVPYGWFGGAVVVRDLLLLALCALVVRDIYRPEQDVVRADGVDDPAGGVLDGAPARWGPGCDSEPGRHERKHGRHEQRVEQG